MDLVELALSSVPSEKRLLYKAEIEKHLHDEMFFISLGEGLFSKGKNEEATHCFKQAIVINPDSAHAYHALGMAFQKLKWNDEAREAFEKATKLAPDSAEAWNNLGIILVNTENPTRALKCFERAILNNKRFHPAFFNLGLLLASHQQIKDAIPCFLKVIELEPKHIDAHLSLASQFGKLGMKEKAIHHYATALDLDPSRKAAEHMLSSLKGIEREVAPREYVEELFDSYANKFDEHLVQQLNYNVPFLIAEMVEKSKPATVSKFAVALDLGCGTGLSGKKIRAITEKLIGVDLSAKMLEKAKNKHLYTELVHSDIESYLEQSKDDFDLVVASDVFVYVGKLEVVFSSLNKRMKPGGLLIFSVERSLEKPLHLQESGRFSHSTDYIKGVCADSFEFLEKKEAALRVDMGKTISGDIYLFKKKTI